MLPSSAAAPPPRLHLLGGVALHGTQDPAAADRLLAQPKVVALLAYLALAAAKRPARYQRRDRMVGLLWPELDQPHARGALRKAVHAARGVLGADALLSRGDEELALAEGALWCDAVAFGEAEEAGQIARALELYAGELLPGFHLAECAEFGRWLDDARAELRERAAGAAWALASHLADREHLTEAGRWARRAVRYAWDDERALRRALVLLDRVGDRAGALRLYDEFVRRLRAEYEAEPSRETAALAAALRGGAPLPAPTPRPPGTRPLGA